MRARRKVKAHERGQAVKVFSDGREVCLNTAAGWREYNSRRDQMAERQGKRCALCGFPFDGYLGDPTFDHAQGRNPVGRDERIVVNGRWQNAAVHSVCNGLKGSRRYHWIDGRYIPAVFASVQDWEAAA